jgi:hypothetical protein
VLEKRKLQCTLTSLGLSTVPAFSSDLRLIGMPWLSLAKTHSILDMRPGKKGSSVEETEDLDTISNMRLRNAVAFHLGEGGEMGFPRSKIGICGGQTWLFPLIHSRIFWNFHSSSNKDLGISVFRLARKTTKRDY